VDVDYFNVLDYYFSIELRLWAWIDFEWTKLNLDRLGWLKPERMQ